MDGWSVGRSDGGKKCMFQTKTTTGAYCASALVLVWSGQIDQLPKIWQDHEKDLFDPIFLGIPFLGGMEGGR